MQISRAKFAAFAEALWSLRMSVDSSPRAAVALAAVLRALFPDAVVAIAPVLKTRRTRAPRRGITSDFTLTLGVGRQEVSVRLPESAGTCDRFLLRELKSCSAIPHTGAPERRARSAQEVLWPHLPRLTPRETEVLRWLAVGKRDGEIATTIGAARRTVNKHVENILRKFKVETRGAAARLAADHRLEDSRGSAKTWL